MTLGPSDRPSITRSLLHMHTTCARTILPPPWYTKKSDLRTSDFSAHPCHLSIMSNAITFSENRLRRRRTYARAVANTARTVANLYQGAQAVRGSYNIGRHLGRTLRRWTGSSNAPAPHMSRGSGGGGGGGVSLGTKRPRPRRRRSTSRGGIMKRIDRKIKNQMTHPKTDWQFRRLAHGYSCTSTENQVGFQGIIVNQVSSNKSLLENYRPLYYNTTGPAFALAPAQDLESFSNVKMQHAAKLIKVEFRNAAPNPVKVKIYYFMCKSHTDHTPLYFFQQDVDDANNAAATWESEPNVYPTDYKRLWAKFFKLVKTNTYLLAPGELQNFYVTHSGYIYNDDDVDASGQLYRKNQTGYLLVRTEGTPVHDSVSENDVGLSGTQLDFVIKYNDKYRYLIHHSLRQDILQDSLGSITIAESIAPQGDAKEMED